MPEIKIDIPKHNGATIDGNAIKIKAILDAITEAIKEDLITKAFQDAPGATDYNKFVKEVPFEEMTIDSFNLSVSSEEDFSLPESIYSDTVKILNKHKDLKIKENWDDAPPVTCCIKPRPEGDEEDNDFYGYVE